MSAVLSKVLAGLASTLLGWVLKLATAGITYWTGKRAGRAADEAEDKERTLDAIKRAQDARRGVDHSPDSVQRDRFNRD